MLMDSLYYYTLYDRLLGTAVAHVGEGTYAFILARYAHYYTCTCYLSICTVILLCTYVLSTCIRIYYNA